METVGVYLKKEREAKNISLREVSRLTKISEFYLDYIEKNEFAKLPQGPYIKGYISSYSKLIGGNIDEALNLYDSINRKRNPTEDIQSEISKNNGRNNQPEKPKANERKKFTASLVGKHRFSFKKVPPSQRAVSSTRKASASSRRVSPLKVAGASIKTTIPIFKKTAFAMTTHRWLTHRRTWRYACFALLGAGLLSLAGFGFYHLFIDVEHPPKVAELQILQDKDTPTLPAMDAEKKVLPSRSNDASVTSRQREESANKKELFPLLSLAEDQKRPLSLSTTPDTAVSRAASNTERPISTSKPAIQVSTPPSSSSLPAENAASSRTSADKESSVQSGQRRMPASPSPGDATATINLSVVQASISSKIKDRMPDGVDTSFPSSVQRVYVWNQIEAKQIPSKIRHIYYFKGQRISEVTLNVPAPYWRTWSYKSISNNRYRGEWRVDIASADGKVLRRLYFEVK